MSLKNEVLFFSVSGAALSRKVRTFLLRPPSPRTGLAVSTPHSRDFDVLEAWYLEACRPCTRWYVEWF